MSALITPTQSNKREKKKERNEQKETPTSDRKPNKGKEQDHLKKTSLGPLRQGKRLDTSKTKQNSSKERKLSYGPPWAHYLGGYQDRLLGGPLGLPDLRCTAPAGVKHKDYRGEVLG
jgi:hypothetical protein